MAEADRTLLKRKRSSPSPSPLVTPPGEDILIHDEPAEPPEPPHRPTSNSAATGHAGSARSTGSAGRTEGNEAQEAQVRLEKLQFGESFQLSSQNCAILSVDFAFASPETEEDVSIWKLVTAGQDGCVKLWAVPLPKPSQNTSRRPRWLCTMKHEAAVNCARWSPTGRMIASCDAEALRVWAPGSWNLQQDLKAPEPWHRHCLLRGHQGEVCDVSWHPNLHPDFTLASCSHDGTIRLWSVPRAELSALLRPTENGYIKGVAFDPLGQFLACMSDGSSSHSKQITATLWQSPEDAGDADGRPSHARNTRQERGGDWTAGWQQVPINQQPWEKPGLLSATVNFRRPSWDPLGQSVVYPFGEHKKFPLSTCRFYAALFTPPWKTPRLYRGHKQHVAVARFCPTVFGQFPGKSKDAPEKSHDAPDVAVVLALACMDGMLSIWLSNHPVPLLVLKDIVAENCFITDIAWTSDGSGLAFSSSGGLVGSVSISWNKILPYGAWTLQEVLQWRCQRHLHVMQPSWDLPSSIHALPDLQASCTSNEVQGQLRTGKPPKFLQFYVQDPDLQTALTGRAEWAAVPKFLTQGVTRIIDVESAQQRQKLFTNWRPAARIPKTSPVPPTFAWSVEDDGTVGCSIFHRRILRIEPMVASTGHLCRVSSKLEGGPSWQISLQKRVVLAKLQGPTAVLLVEAAQSPKRQLIILASESGRLLAPPLLLPLNCPKMKLAENGTLLLLLDSACLKMWQLRMQGAPELVLSELVPKRYHTAEIGVLRMGPCGVPYLRRGGKSHIAVYNEGLKSWLMIRWRLLEKLLAEGSREDVFCTWPDVLKPKGASGAFDQLGQELSVRQVLPGKLHQLLELLLELGFYAVEEDLPGLLLELRGALALAQAPPDEETMGDSPGSQSEVSPLGRKIFAAPAASLAKVIKLSMTTSSEDQLQSTATQLEMLLTNLEVAAAQRCWMHSDAAGRHIL